MRLKGPVTPTLSQNISLSWGGVTPRLVGAVKISDCRLPIADCQLEEAPGKMVRIYIQVHKV